MNFLDKVLKNTQISDFMQIPLVAGELFIADGQTWRRYVYIYIYRERERATVFNSGQVDIMHVSTDQSWAPEVER